MMPEEVRAMFFNLGKFKVGTLVKLLPYRFNYVRLGRVDKVRLERSYIPHSIMLILYKVWESNTGRNNNYYFSLKLVAIKLFNFFILTVWINCRLKLEQFSMFISIAFGKLIEIKLPHYICLNVSHSIFSLCS